MLKHIVISQNSLGMTNLFFLKYTSLTKWFVQVICVIYSAKKTCDKFCDLHLKNVFQLHQVVQKSNVININSIKDNESVMWHCHYEKYVLFISMQHCNMEYFSPWNNSYHPCFSFLLLKVYTITCTLATDLKFGTIFIISKLRDTHSPLKIPKSEMSEMKVGKVCSLYSGRIFLILLSLIQSCRKEMLS